MNSNRILITGGSGLLALNWACCMRDKCEVFLAQHMRKIRLQGTRTVTLELESIETLLPQVEACQPEMIIHTAGATSVDQCEREPQMAHQANAVLARNVAVVAARLGIRFVHISTDHLFAGTRPLYTESAAPEPLNVYARTKLLAEQWVIEAQPKALIVRTNFFGWGHRFRQSFSDWIFHSLSKGEPLTMFDDAFFTPVLADRLAASIHRLAKSNASGIFNVVGDERISRYDFAVRLARHFALPETLIHHGRISQASLTARRPPDMSLDNTKARAALGSGLGTPKEYFEALHHQQLAGRQSELLQAISAD